mmetsp:Transcript_22292/g.29152  ORF Transcript_22292/g.29152 Transcript_22292/m.29152 type:complete len:195 (-) Transcript_22292:316-900(-)
MFSGPTKSYSESSKQIIERALSVGSDATEDTLETATFAAGCFWGVELAFQRIPGVLETAVGYTAGSLENPTYQQVCSGLSGHTEAVQLKFNPSVVSFDDLLRVLFDIMNPTQLNGQGNDWGTQYRSGIYYHSPEQKEAAEAFIEQESAKYGDPIVTEVESASEFYPAETYHQQYLVKGGQSGEKGDFTPIRCYG